MGSGIPEDHACMAKPLRIAGKRFRRILTDAEIKGCWDFAWLPEASGNVRHEFLEVRPTFDPVTARYLNPHNLGLSAFIDAFTKHPEEVLKLLKKFREHINGEASPGSVESQEGQVHASMLEHGTGKEAAHHAAELAGVRTPEGIETIQRKIRRAAALVKGKGPLWPMAGRGPLEPIPVKPKERTN